MKAKLITSGLYGICIPWLYFVIFNVGSVRTVGPEGVVTAAGGVSGFIEFEGLFGALTIYAQSILICSVFVFIVCTTYDFLKGALRS